VLHVAADRLESVSGHELAQQPHALLICSDLSLDVGQVRERFPSRAGKRAPVRVASKASRSKCPARTMQSPRSTTPSSASSRENGGIEPGVMPPMSA
jgi:hypothetical protein